MAGGGVIIIVIVFVFILVLSITGGLWYYNYLCDFGLGGGSCPSQTPEPSSAPGPSGGGGGGGGPQARAPGPSGTPGGARGPSASSPGGSGATLGYSPARTPGGMAPAPVSSKVNCVGHWDPCNGTCGSDKVRTYVIDTPARNGGDPCKDTDGSILTAGSTMSCGDLGPCGRDCAGNWVTNSSTDADGWSACPSCGSGNQTRTWQNDPARTQIGNGLACVHPNGYTETRPCTGLPQCTGASANRNCVGSWGSWGACSVGCGSTNGTQTREYKISLSSLGTGTACTNDAGTNLETNVGARLETRPCDPPAPMCCADVINQSPWVQGKTKCNESRPSAAQSRNLIVGASATAVDQARCGLELYREVYTTKGCDNKDPVNGVSCTQGGTWVPTGAAGSGIGYCSVNLGCSYSAWNETKDCNSHRATSTRTETRPGNQECGQTTTQTRDLDPCNDCGQDCPVYDYGGGGGGGDADYSSAWPDYGF